jgi:hypothetical protein
MLQRAIGCFGCIFATAMKRRKYFGGAILFIKCEIKLGRTFNQ